MTFDEFVETLDKKNYYTEELTNAVKFYQRDHAILFERKGRDLFEVITSHLNKKLYPIVDKNLGVVFGVRPHLHTGMRLELFRYHNAPNNPKHDCDKPERVCG